MAVDALARIAQTSVRDVALAIAETKPSDQADSGPDERAARMQQLVSERRAEWRGSREHAGYAEIHQTAESELPTIPWCAGCSERRWWQPHWHCQKCGHNKEGPPARWAFRDGDDYQPVRYSPSFAGWVCGSCLVPGALLDADVPPLATPVQLFFVGLGLVGRVAVDADDARRDPAIAAWFRDHYGFEVPGA
jgi:hypothetical protein